MFQYQETMLPGTCVFRANGTRWCPASSKEGFVSSMPKEVNGDLLINVNEIKQQIVQSVVGAASDFIVQRGTKAAPRHSVLTANSPYSIPVTQLSDVLGFIIPANRVIRVTTVLSVDNFSALNTFFRKLIANNTVTPDMAKRGVGMDIRFTSLGFKCAFSMAIRTNERVNMTIPGMFQRAAAAITDLCIRCPDGYLAPLMKSEIIIEVLSNNNGGNFTDISASELNSIAVDLAKMDLDKTANAEADAWIKTVRLMKCGKVDIYNMIFGAPSNKSIKETFDDIPISSQVVNAVTRYLPSWAKFST